MVILYKLIVFYLEQCIVTANTKSNEIRVAAGLDQNLKNIYDSPSNFRTVVKRIVNPLYFEKFDEEANEKIYKIANDVGLLKLESPFILGPSTGIYAACLNKIFLITKGNKLIGAGYGRIVSGRQIKITDASTLELRFGEYTYEGRSESIKGKAIGYITGSTSTVCNGDSGGPVIQFIDNRAYVVGVLSTGFSWFGCEIGSYTAFAQISYNHDFIRKHIGDNLCSYSF